MFVSLLSPSGSIQVDVSIDDSILGTQKAFVEIKDSLTNEEGGISQKCFIHKDDAFFYLEQFKVKGFMEIKSVAKN